MLVSTGWGRGVWRSSAIDYLPGLPDHRCGTGSIRYRRPSQVPDYGDWYLRLTLWEIDKDFTTKMCSLKTTAAPGAQFIHALVSRLRADTNISNVIGESYSSSKPLLFSGSAHAQQRLKDAQQLLWFAAMLVQHY
jgi:hypothetical protein